MGSEQRPRGLAIEPQHRVDEPLGVVQCGRGPRSAVAGKQLRHLGTTLEQRELIQRVARQPRVARRRRVRIGAVRQQPVGEAQIPLFHRDLEQKPRARSVAAHVEHRPAGLLPRLAARGADRVLVHQLEPPQHLAAEMRVVKNLDVERVGATFEQQLEQRGGIRLSRRILLPFAGGADQRAVARVAGHVKVVGVGAVIEQQPRDRQRVGDSARMGETRVGQVQDRGPVARAAAIPRRVRPRRHHPLHFLELAAHDCGVDTLARDRWVLAEQPLRRAIVHPVVALSVNMMIPACRLQEGDNALSVLNVVSSTRGGSTLGQQPHGIHLVPQRRPRERRAVRRRPPLAVPSRTRCIRLERTVDRAGIAVENPSDAVGAIGVDRIKEVDVAIKDHVGRRHVPGIPGPSRRRGAVLAVAHAWIRAVLQQNRRCLVVAVKRGGVQRGVAFRLVDRRFRIILHVDDGQSCAVAHGSAKQHLHHAARGAAAGVHDEARPSAIVAEKLRTGSNQALEILAAVERDCRRERHRRAGVKQRLRHPRLAVERGLVERRQADCVLQIQIGPKLD